MIDLFSVTAPLMIRLPSGEGRLLAERFPHPKGLLYFEPFWHLAERDGGIHVVEGEIRGEGPWRVGDCVVHVLGCRGTDACLATDFEAWRQYLFEQPEAYPPRPLIEAIARRHGASP